MHPPHKKAFIVCQWSMKQNVFSVFQKRKIMEKRNRRERRIMNDLEQCRRDFLTILRITLSASALQVTKMLASVQKNRTQTGAILRFE